jgi:hypothetical protein
MPYEPFHERFPEIAEKETRTLIAINDPDLPDGEYGLVEAYCNEPDCDCRRVFFHVADWRTGRILAVIAYGWESKEYYVKWFGENDPDIIKKLQGPALNLLSHQSELAPVLLQKVKYVLRDRNYLGRIKRHYEMFKETVDDEVVEEVEEEEPETPPPAIKEKISRNAPCPCGSGKKYKKCCGK